MEKSERLLSGKEAAGYLGISEQTLRIHRIKGGGINFVKIGGCVRYRKSDIEAYLQKRTFGNTSQTGKLR